MREGQNQMGGGVVDWVGNSSKQQGLGVQITHWDEKCGVQGAFETCKKDVSRAVGYTALELEIPKLKGLNMGVICGQVDEMEAMDVDKLIVKIK